MITSHLFEQILINPVVEQGANELFVVSGYATAAMAFHHFQQLYEDEFSLKVHLIVGMAVQDGLSLSNHRGFQNLMNNDLAGVFECSYVMEHPPVHSKVYAWLRDGEPVAGFIGSANYSQKAFYHNQREAMEECSPEYGIDYYQELNKDTIYCIHPDADNFVTIFNDKYFAQREREMAQDVDELPFVGISGLEHVKVPLVNRDGIVSARSGLNWGQRPGREPNQAYIPLPAEIIRLNFFPPRGQHFTIYTDDNKTLTCTRAQDNGKAIETPQNNSQLGEYFRRRLGLPNGAFVTVEHLREYGRLDIDFYKMDEETYYMDFHV